MIKTFCDQCEREFKPESGTGWSHCVQLENGKVVTIEVRIIKPSEPAHLCRTCLRDAVSSFPIKLDAVYYKGVRIKWDKP